MMSAAPQHLLLVDDDRILAESLALGLERDGRVVIVCNDIESAEMALARFPVTHIVSDVQFSGAFGFEGLHFAGRTKESRPHRMILMTGDMSDALRTAAPGFGADAILAKPFTIDELESALRSPVACSDAPARTIHVPTIDRLLECDGLTTAFQPIVSLAGGTPAVFGYEALSRCRRPWPLGGPSDLFDYASKCSRLEKLNRETVSRAIREAAALPEESRIFMNVDPAALDAGLAATIRTACDEHRVDPARLVVEITERSGFPDETKALAAVEDLRSLGIRFALDDLGSAYSHIHLIERIAPAFIKISSAFGIDFELDHARRRMVEHIGDLARDFGALTILEGIESLQSADSARRIGVPLAQGYFFGRPDTAVHWSRSRVA